MILFDRLKMIEEYCLFLNMVKNKGEDFCKKKIDFVLKLKRKKKFDLYLCMINMLMLL